MLCSACRQANEEGARFCSGCGAALAAACSACGHENPAGAAFCNACGTPLGAAAAGLVRGASDPRSYTPRHLAERILRTRSALEGERKHVTVLFCDVADSTPLAVRLGPEEMHALMDRFIQIVCEEVHAVEGTVNQFLGDGAMALFGAPLALEDAPRRAVRAALGIQRALAPLAHEVSERFGAAFRARIGIHSGPVVVGRIGDDLRMDYTAVGDTTHLAARLQSVAAPGGILLSEATQHLVAGYFDLTDLGHIGLRGIAEEVRAYALVGERAARDRVEASAATGLTPLVGRDRELAALAEAFAAARAGRARVAFVVGEAGLGKSRLLFEFRQTLADVPHAWIEGRCASYARDTAFHPIADAVRRSFDITDRDGEGAALGKLEEREAEAGGALAWTLPFVRHLLSLPLGDEAAEQMDAATRRSETFRALRARLERAATAGPVVFLIEDLHWIDHASEEFLEYLVDGAASLPALVVFSQRPGYRASFGGRPDQLQLPLQPLSEREMGDMTGAVLEAANLSSELRELVARKAEGNPFFVEEVTKSLLEVGALRSIGGRVELARALENVEVPDSIQGVLMARLDRLGDEPKRALQLASVIGREFAVRLLERIHAQGERLLPLLAELRTLELIFEKSLHSELAFMFKHALTHDVAYASVLTARRKSLHRIVGSAIEELYRDRLAEHYEALAHHFSEGEEWEKAFFYHVRAAEKATEAFANQTAAEHCRRALALAEQLGERVPREVRGEIEQRLGHVLYLAGAFDPSGDAYERAAAFADEADLRALQHARAAYSFSWGHAYDRTRASLEAGSAAARGARGGVAEGMVELSRSFLHAIEGDLEAYEERLERGAALAASSGEAAAFSGYLRSQLAEWHGDYPLALRESGRAIEAARKERLPHFLAPAVWFHAKALCCVGEYGLALETGQQGLDFAERLGNRALQARLLNTIGWIHAETGAAGRAAQCNERATAIAGEMIRDGLVPGAPEIYGNAVINLASNQLALGELGRAETLVAEIREQLAHESDPWMLWRYRVHWLDAEGRLALARGDADGAAAYADRALEAARAQRGRKLEARALELRARALLQSERREEAGAALREALSVAEAIGYPPVRWRAHALDAELARRAGRGADAQAAAARVRALTHQAALRVDPDLSRELRALGERLVSAPLSF